MLPVLLPALLQSQPDARALASDALTHVRARQSELLNYTYIDTEHDTTHGGIFPSHHTTVFETIALQGTQYTRRLEKDGNPLSGKDLEHEQQLYERAISERRAVSEVRAEQKGNTLHKVSGLLDRLLNDFDIRISGEEEVDAHLCTVLVF